MKRLIQLLGATILCVYMYGCIDKTVIYHTYHPFSLHGWARSDTVRLQVVVPDSNQTYRAMLLLRMMNTYPYTNLAATLSWTDSVAHQDTLYINFADTTEQQPLRANRPDLYEKVIPIGSVYVSRPDTLTFRLVHIMKDWSLRGIHDIGIMIER